MSNDESRNEPLCFVPAGLELIHESELAHISSLSHVFFIATHWSLIRGGLRTLNVPLEIESSLQISPISPQVLTSFQNGLSEKPERGWGEKISKFSDIPAIFNYVNPLVPQEGFYQLKLFSLVHESVVELSNNFSPAMRLKTATNSTNIGGDSVAAAFSPSTFVRFGPDWTTVPAIYFNVAALERRIFVELFSELGLPAAGPIPKSIGIYDDKTKEKKTNSSSERNEESYRRPEASNSLPPYRAPPIGVGGIGGIGRSDLNPFGSGGGGVGGGMLGDLRGVRWPGPHLPGAPNVAPPGARFDPFGPVGPNPNRFPGPGGPGRPGRMPPFGGPDPDNELPPPGFDDMFM